MSREIEPGFEPSADDPVYQEMLAREAAMWANPFLDYEINQNLVPRELNPILNESLTGRPDVDWLEDLAGRGPFGNGATLGSTSGYLEKRWLELRASASLDIYELSEGVIAKTRERLASANVLDGVRFHRVDLNLCGLPVHHYDIVWSAGALHHLVNLEYVCDQVAESLKPGGLFAFHEYVGDRRIQFDPLRVKLTEEALDCVPSRFFRGARKVRVPDLTEISPFEAVRSDEIHSIVSSRFECLHWRTMGVLLPIGYTVDMLAIAREEPQLLDQLLLAERKGAESGLGGCVGYGVFRRR
jgi:SAM-dependent methyltransferase